MKFLMNVLVLLLVLIFVTYKIILGVEREGKTEAIKRSLKDNFSGGFSQVTDEEISFIGKG